MVVTNPASKSCLDSRHPDVHPKTAASMAENAKRTKYGRVYNAENHMENISNNMIPFALEATGTYGPAAMETIFKLAKLTEAVPEYNA